MIILDGIQYLLAAIIGVLFGYQMVLSFLALLARKVKNPSADRYRKFAVVVPAHNEEQVLSKTLYSLFGLVYPKSLYDIIVVADNCTDKTAAIARNLDAIVLERMDAQKKGKGYALRWAFDQILEWETKYDAVIVFDADTLVSGDYLKVMNHYLANGSRVIQSSDLVLPQPGKWSIEATRIGFLLYNYVKPLGRKVLGFDMGLRGNGMCFSREILREYPWEAWSLTEDVEYGLNLLLQGIKINFAPEATVWAQMPAKAENAESQRRRWEMGRYPIIREYAPKLFAASIEKRSFRHLDTLCDLVFPPLVNTMFFVLVMVVLNIVLWFAGWGAATFIWIWLGITAAGLLHLFIGMIAAKADRQLYKSMVYIPIYMIWKLKVYVKAGLTGRDHKWIRTARETEGDSE